MNARRKALTADLRNMYPEGKIGTCSACTGLVRPAAPASRSRRELFSFALENVTPKRPTLINKPRERTIRSHMSSLSFPQEQHTCPGLNPLQRAHHWRYHHRRPRPASAEFLYAPISLHSITRQKKTTHLSFPPVIAASLSLSAQLSSRGDRNREERGSQLAADKQPSRTTAAGVA